MLGVWYSQFNLHSNSWEAVVQNFMRDVEGNLVLHFSGEKYASAHSTVVHVHVHRDVTFVTSSVSAYIASASTR